MHSLVNVASIAKFKVTSTIKQLLKSTISSVARNFNVRVLNSSKLHLLIFRVPHRCCATCCELTNFIIHLDCLGAISIEWNCWWLICALTGVFVLVSLAPASASKHAHCEPHCTEHHSHNHSRHTNSSGEGGSSFWCRHFTVVRCGLQCARLKCPWSKKIVTLNGGPLNYLLTTVVLLPIVWSTLAYSVNFMTYLDAGC